MPLDDLRYFTYTHTNCNDLWKPYFGQLEKHSPPIKHTVIINSISQEIPCEQIQYYDDKNYCQEYAWCLEQLEEDYVIYMQEDFFLYHDVDEERLLEYLEILKSDESLSFIRLINSGLVSNQKYESHDSLFYVTPPDQDHTLDTCFSMQPTIWNKQRLIDLYRECGRQTFGEDGFIAPMNKLGIKGLYHFENEFKRGMMHYDSNVFPYTCTAVVRKKWNTLEYELELSRIAEEYNLDLSGRGHLTHVLEGL